MPEPQPGLVPLLITRQAASGGVPLYPENLPGSAQAHAIQNFGRTLRWGTVCQRLLILVVVAVLAAIAVAVVLQRESGTHPPSSSGSS